MGDQVTLRHPGTGHVFVADSPETVSNYHYGRGYEIVPNRPEPEASPTEPPPEPAPAAPGTDEPDRFTALLGATKGHKP